MSKRALAAAMSLVVLALALSGCRRGVREGEARLTVGDGAQVLVEDEGRPLEPVQGSRTLRHGALVKVVGGLAKLELPGDADLELLQGSELRVASDPVLVAGRLLVVTSRSLVVDAGGSRIEARGATRLSRDLAVSAANYRGELAMESAGRRLEIPALRQASVASLGLVPAEPQPLRYRMDDPWDRRFLGPAMELGEELQARSRGLTASLPPGEGRAPAFYRLLLPPLEREPSFDSPLLSDPRPPGETLVGAAIAVSGRNGTFLTRWSGVFSFRQQGAAWGLVALDQGIGDGDGLVRSLDRAIDQAPLAFLLPSQPAPAAPSGTRRRDEQAQRGPARSRGAGGQPASGGSGAQPAPGGTLPRPPSTPADPVVDPLVDVIDGLIP